MERKLARLFNWTGIAVMVLLIIICIPFTIPKLFGLKLFEVKTESMEPVYPVGSVIYVRNVEAAEVAEGDAITYTLGTDTDLVMTHRVIAISEEEQTFITKGDANEAEDAEPVKFSRLIGKPVFCISGIAAIAGFMNSENGTKMIILAFLVVLILWLSADVLKKREKKSENVIK